MSTSDMRMAAARLARGQPRLTASSWPQPHPRCRRRCGSNSRSVVEWCCRSECRNNGCIWSNAMRRIPRNPAGTGEIRTITDRQGMKPNPFFRAALDAAIALWQAALRMGIARRSSSAAWRQKNRHAMRRQEINPSAKKIGGPNRILVQKGDTLYSIAFNYGFDYHDLAELNGIQDPSVISDRTGNPPVSEQIQLRPALAACRPGQT